MGYRNSSVMQKNFGKKWILVFLLLLSKQVYAVKITFLPFHIQGNLPVNYQHIQNPQIELAVMQGYFSSENFHVETSTRDEIAEAGRLAGRKYPDKQLIRSICNLTKSTYIVYSEISFSTRSIFRSEVFHCNQDEIQKKEKILGSSSFIEEMRKSVLDSFSFLPSKSRNKPEIVQGRKHIVFILDYSKSLHQEIGILNKILKQQSGNKIGAIIVKKNGIDRIPVAMDNSGLTEYLENRKPEGDVSLDKMADGILVARSIATEPEKTKFVIITDARVGDVESIKFLNNMRTLGTKASSLVLLSGSYSNPKTLNFYKKAVRSCGGTINEITHFQKIGLVDGYYYLYLRDLNLYWDKQENFSSDLDLTTKHRIPQGMIFSKNEFVRPEQMVHIFAENTGKKVLESYPVQSNLGLILEKTFQISEIETGMKKFMI